MLSAKGREPYIRMQMWNEDPLAIEKLKLFQSNADSRKRRGSSSCPSPGPESPPAEKRPHLTPGIDPETPPPPTIPGVPSDLMKDWLKSEMQQRASQFDLFRLLYSSQQQLAQQAQASLSKSQGSQGGVTSGDEGDNKSDSNNSATSEKSRRKSLTPQQFISGGSGGASNSNAAESDENQEPGESEKQ